MRAVLRRRLAGRSHSRAIERPFAGREGMASGDSPFFAPPGSGFRYPERSRQFRITRAAERLHEDQPRDPARFRLRLVRQRVRPGGARPFEQERQTLRDEPREEGARQHRQQARRVRREQHVRRGAALLLPRPARVRRPVRPGGRVHRRRAGAHGEDRIGRSLGGGLRGRSRQHGAGDDRRRGRGGVPRRGQALLRVHAAGGQAGLHARGGLRRERRAARGHRAPSRHPAEPVAEGGVVRGDRVEDAVGVVLRQGARHRGREPLAHPRRPAAMFDGGVQQRGVRHGDAHRRGGCRGVRRQRCRGGVEGEGLRGRERRRVRRACPVGHGRGGVRGRAVAEALRAGAGRRGAARARGRGEERGQARGEEP